MNAREQFYELVARRFYEIENAKIERAEILLNLKSALQRGEITQAEYDEIVSTWPSAESRRQP